MGRTLKDNKFRNGRKKKNSKYTNDDEFTRKRVNGMKHRILKDLQELEEEEDSFDGDYCVNQ